MTCINKDMNMNLIILDFLKMSENSKNRYMEGIIMKTANIKEVKIMKKVIMTLF